MAEIRISSGGAHLEAKETSEDMYASIDKVIDKLERQIRGTKGAALSKKRRSGDSLRGSEIAGAAAVATTRSAPRRAKAKSRKAGGAAR
jgi:putative sigma-54 modulation protein